MINENYTKISNEILEKLTIGKFNATHYRILLTILRYTSGFQRNDHKLSVSFISNSTNSSSQVIKRGLKELIDMKIITVVKEATFSSPRVLKINENFDTWIMKDYQDNEIIPGYSNDTTPGYSNDTLPGYSNDTQEIKERNTKKKGTPKNADTKKPYETYFDEIWNLYPRKKGKSNVSGKQKLYLYQNVPIEIMKKAIQKYKVEVAGVEEKFIKHGSTFFNNGYIDYIDDEPPEKEPEIQPGKYKPFPTTIYSPLSDLGEREEPW